MEEQPKPVPPKKPRRTKLMVGIACIVLVVAGALGAAGYFYNKYQQIWNDPQIVAKEEVKHLTERAGRLIELPKDETPTIATVSDKEQLKEQAFFNSAQNGDKLLLYAKAKKAFLYRLSEDKIIEVAPMIIDNTAATGAKPAGR